MVVEIWEFFGLILQNLNLICVIGTVETYLGFWGKRLNFDITIAEIQPKVWEKRRKMWTEKMLNFGNVDTEIPLSNSAAWVWEMCVECPKWKEKEKKNWQTNCGNAVAEIGKKIVTIVAMALSKMGEKKSGFEIWGEKKKSVTFTIFSQ